MNSNNVLCLFHCAKAITGCDINSIEQLKNFTFYYKILDISSEKSSAEDIEKVISEYFNNNFENVFDDTDENNWFLKILLLVIVMYILKSNDSNKKPMLVNLCDGIPLELHSNACGMFAPIILRFSEGEIITGSDLDKCLLDSDKENQASFFSPMKSKERLFSHDQQTFVTQKRKIHKSLQACRRNDKFETYIDDQDQSEPEDQSSLVKLVNYVQSPDYQTKRLMKCNRELGKNVNDLEFQLFMNSDFETELDKTINRWKEKCKSLEIKLKQARTNLQLKEEEIVEKNTEIENANHLANHNKRLEERIKDFQQKVAELQLISAQYDEKIDENAKLKTEIHTVNHYYSVAKERLTEMETLLKDFKYEKEIKNELNETREHLSKTEAQLADLLSHMQSSQHHSIDNISETSFNSSFYNPEPLSYVVEKERDELLIEMNRLKEHTVDREIHESVVHGLNVELSESHDRLVNTTAQLTSLLDEQSSVARLCQSIEQGVCCDVPLIGVADNVNRLFIKQSVDVTKLKEDLSQLLIANGNLLTSLNDKEIQVEQTNSQLCFIEKECRSIFNQPIKDNEINFGLFIESLKEKLANNDRTVATYENRASYLRLQLPSVCNDLNVLRKSVEEAKKMVEEVKKEIVVFKNPLLESIHVLHREFDSLNHKYNDVIITKGNVEHELNKTIAKYDGIVNNLKEISESEVNALNVKMNNMKKELTEKHFAEEDELKRDMEKLIINYQECLDEMERMGEDHEQRIGAKDSLLTNEVRKNEEVSRKLQEREHEISELSESVRLLKKEVEESSSKDAQISELKSIVDNLVHKDQDQTQKYQELNNRIDYINGLYGSAKLSINTVNELLISKEEELAMFKEKVVGKEDEITYLELKLSKRARKMEHVLAENCNIKTEMTLIKNKNMVQLKELRDKVASLNEELTEVRNEMLQKKETCVLQDGRIEELNVLLGGFEDLKDRYAKLNSLYQSATTSEEQLNVLIDDLRLSKESELSTVKEELYVLQTKFGENLRVTEGLMQENECLKSEVTRMKAIESSHQEQLEISVRNAERLKVKCSTVTLENDTLSTELSFKISEMERVTNEKGQEIETLHDKLRTAQQQLKYAEDSLQLKSQNLSSIEEKIVQKDSKISDLEENVSSQKSQIDALTLLLSAKEEEMVVQKAEVELKASRLSKLASVNEENRDRLMEMSALIERLEEICRQKSAQVEATTLDMETCKTSLAQSVLKNAQMQAQIDDLVLEKNQKESDIDIAKSSIDNFTSKIQNLESTIEEEMKNYAKISDECKHAESESMEYLNRYNDLVKRSRDELQAKKQIIDQLSDRIRKIEDERDDQIHSMEKSFNGKIFELQQSVESSEAELQSVREEACEGRRAHRAVRVHLEAEVERLQKAMQNREVQFQEEKALLKVLIERERDETLKFRNGSEAEIARLRAEAAKQKEGVDMELGEARARLASLEAAAVDGDRDRHRLIEKHKEEEARYQTEIGELHARVEQLEPLEGQIKRLEDMSRRLMGKVAKMESSDDGKELAHLRQQTRSQSEQLALAERREKEAAAERAKGEQRIRNVLENSEDLVRVNAELKESMAGLQDQLQSMEARCHSRASTIDNLDREIRSLTTDNDSLKKRYLTMKEIHERHQQQMERDHQTAVDGYIARITALSNDVSKFQDQMQLLTEEKNLLIEKNYSSKRLIDEHTSKLDGLQKLVWNHTENERRRMLVNFDENSRYTRMSHWAEKPQMNRQLPPVSRIDQKLADSLGLDSVSRARFESYVCSPYGCEDEGSLSLQKELPPIPPRRPPPPSTPSQAPPLPPMVTPTKKRAKKDGARLQLSARIRRSLHMDPSSSPAPHGDGKPPVAPPKKASFMAAVRSHLNIVDVNQLRRSGRKTAKAEPGDCQTPLANVPSTSSTYSLFDVGHKDDGGSQSQASSSRCSRDPKTPKPNSVIRNFIRRSRNLSPKRKRDSLSSL